MKCSSILLGLSEPFTLENFPTTQSSESFNLNWKYFDISFIKMNQSINTNLWRVQIFKSLLLSSLRVSIPPSNSECTIVTDDITRFIQIVCRPPAVNELYPMLQISSLKSCTCTCGEYLTLTPSSRGSLKIPLFENLILLWVARHFNPIKHSPMYFDLYISFSMWI